uniref:Uncharacterized protein n=1 Tax=Romanomermis culicivorax TaxID=13658 RepID=A0A915KB67_ROMCU
MMATNLSKLKATNV